MRQRAMELSQHIEGLVRGRWAGLALGWRLGRLGWGGRAWAAVGQQRRLAAPAPPAASPLPSWPTPAPSPAPCRQRTGKPAAEAAAREAEAQRLRTELRDLAAQASCPCCKGGAVELGAGS